MSNQDFKRIYDKYKLKQDKLYVSDYDMFVEQIKLIEDKK